MAKKRIKTQNFDDVRGVRFYREADLTPMVEFVGVRATADPRKPGALIRQRWSLNQFMVISGQIMGAMADEQTKTRKIAASLREAVECHAHFSGAELEPAS